MRFTPKYMLPAAAMLLLGGCTVQATPASMAETPKIAQLWTPPALSTDGYESSPSFSPDGKTMLYFTADANFRNYRLMESRCTPDGWSAGAPPAFALPLPVVDTDPFFTPDGKGVYFVSSVTRRARMISISTMSRVRQRVAGARPNACHIPSTPPAQSYCPASIPKDG